MPANDRPTEYFAFTLKTLDMGYVPDSADEPYGRHRVMLADEAKSVIDYQRELLREVVEKLEWIALGDGNSLHPEYLSRLIADIRAHLEGEGT